MQIILIIKNIYSTFFIQYIEKIIMYKISMIIPIYNAENFLTRCLESIIQQTLYDIEIICINDGSTDNSLAILKKYANQDKRFKIISQENQGTLIARNQGILQASGEYCMFCDADDSYELNACEELYNIITEKNVDAIYFGNYLHIGQLVKNCTPQSCMNSSTTKYDFLLLVNSMTNKIFSTNLLKKSVSYIKNTKIIYGEDLYSTAIISLFINNWMSIEKCYYHYYYSIDSRNYNLFIQNINDTKQALLLSKEASIFANDPDEYLKTLAIKEQKVINGCIMRWLQICPEDKKNQGLQYMFQTFPKKIVLNSLFKATSL